MLWVCKSIKIKTKVLLFTQRRPQIAIANHQITAAQAMQMVPERHSQQVRRMNFVITHTGTSALCTTTKSKPDAATAVILHKRKRGRTRVCILPLAICSASVTGKTTGSGVHIPALMREESNNGPLPLVSQWIRTPPEVIKNGHNGCNRDEGHRATRESTSIRDNFDLIDFGLICSFT